MKTDLELVAMLRAHKMLDDARNGYLEWGDGPVPSCPPEGAEIGHSSLCMKLQAQFLAVLRETGGSLPAHLEQEAQKFGHALEVLGLDPPVLNKSGGGERQRIEAEMRDHFAHCQTPRCGQDGRSSMCAAADAIYRRYLDVLKGRAE